MSTYSSDKYGNQYPAITNFSNEDTCVIATATIPISTKLTDGDIINLLKIPAGFRICSLKVFSEDLDDGTAVLAFDVGLLDAGDTALETVFISGSTIGRAGGLASPTTTTMYTTAAATSEKVLAIEITTTANGDTAASAKIGAVVSYIPA